MIKLKRDNAARYLIVQLELLSGGIGKVEVNKNKIIHLAKTLATLLEKNEREASITVLE